MKTGYIISAFMSLLLHVFIFLAILFAPFAAKTFDKKEVYEIRIISLNKNLKKNASRVKKTKTIKAVVSKKATKIKPKKPQPVVKRKREVKRNEKKILYNKKQKVKKKEKKKVVKKIVESKKRKVKLKRKKILKKKTKLDESYISKRLEQFRKKEGEEYINRLVESLKREKSKNSASGTFGSVVISSKGKPILNPIIMLYVKELEERIKLNWSWPFSLEGKEAVISIRISRDGRLIKYSYEKRSSDPSFDASCLRAIKKSFPFRPLPKAIKDEYLDIGVRFGE